MFVEAHSGGLGELAPVVAFAEMCCQGRSVLEAAAAAAPRDKVPGLHGFRCVGAGSPCQVVMTTMAAATGVLVARRACSWGCLLNGQNSIRAATSWWVHRGAFQPLLVMLLMLGALSTMQLSMLRLESIVSLLVRL